MVFLPDLFAAAQAAEKLSGSFHTVIRLFAAAQAAEKKETLGALAKKYVRCRTGS